MDKLNLKLLAILAAFALVPMISLGVISLMEMNQAYKDIQGNISSLSTSLNRSALSVAPNEADQVQLAIAKAGQYDGFFKRIFSENELVASYVSIGGVDESCSEPPGIWLAPIGSNQTTSLKRSATIRSLCSPARIMHGFMQADHSILFSYIGTEDGVLITWPYNNETMSNTDPFSYKDMPYYSLSKVKKKTIWTGPYMDSKGQPAITITSPIYRSGEFGGIAGMDISLQSINDDLSSLMGRGYPFIIDETGRIVFKSKNKPDGILKDIFDADNLSQVSDIDGAKLASKMLKGRPGSIVIGKGDADGYVAFSPIATPGWSFGIAYPAEEMSLPARFIDTGIKDVAKSATQGLDDSLRKIQGYALLIFAITAFMVLSGWFLFDRRINGQMRSLLSAAENISRGELGTRVGTSGELGSLGTAFNEMAQGLQNYVDHLEGEATMRGGFGKETDFLKVIKQNLVPIAIPDAEGYEILSIYLPSKTNHFDLYDIAGSDGKIAFAMASVGGDGFQAAMLAMNSRTLIRAAHDRMDLSRTINDLNTQINQLAMGMNLACFYAVLDPVNHTLEYVNSGFNPPFIVDLGGMVDTLGGGGIALGMLERIELHKECIPLQPGDVMIIYSNGVVEMENSYRKQFGIEKLINLIISSRSLSAFEIARVVENELKDFSQNMPAKSDIELLILKRS